LATVILKLVTLKIEKKKKQRA